MKFFLFFLNVGIEYGLFLLYGTEREIEVIQHEATTVEQLGDDKK